MPSSWSRFVSALRRWLGGAPTDAQLAGADRATAHSFAGPYRRPAALDDPHGGGAGVDENARLACDVYHDSALVRTVLLDRDKEVIQLGRRSGSDVQLEHDAVSRTHAVVTILDSDALYTRAAASLPADALEIIDLGSAIGTRVNGKLIDRATLRAGDTIEIALFQIQLVLRYGKPGVHPAAAGPIPPRAD